MLKGLEKAKALKEFKELRLKLGGELSALEKAKSIKRFRELRLLLGATAKPTSEPVAEPSNVNPLYQSVIDGAAPSIELLKSLQAEAEKDLEHPQLRPAVEIIYDKVIALTQEQQAA